MVLQGCRTRNVIDRVAPIFAPLDYRFIDDLNAAQRDAVLAPDGPILILAAAGTGNTLILTKIGSPPDQRPNRIRRR